MIRAARCVGRWAWAAAFDVAVIVAALALWEWLRPIPTIPAEWCVEDAVSICMQECSWTSSTSR